MRRSSSWLIPLGALVAIVAGALILNATPHRGQQVAVQTEAVKTESSQFPPPETSVTVTRRGETTAQRQEATAAQTEPVGTTTGEPSAEETHHMAAQSETTPPMAQSPSEAVVGPQPAITPPPQHATARKRHNRPRVEETRPLDRRDQEILQETAPADQVEREAARRTAEIRRAANRRAPEPQTGPQGGDAAAQIVGGLNDREMQDLMEGRMTTNQVATRIHYRGSRRALRQAILQLRDERSGHIRGG